MQKTKIKKKNKIRILYVVIYLQRKDCISLKSTVYFVSYVFNINCRYIIV